MGQNEGEVAFNERVKRRLQVVYARKTRERQMFMRDLRQYRKKNDKDMIRSLKISIGPKWFQALSVVQRAMLDTLQTSMYQDVLAGRPQKSLPVIRALGLHPNPKRSDIMTSIYLAKGDPKEMIAQLYLHTFRMGIEGRRASYNLNARLLLSSIFYLGLDDIIRSLRKTFRPQPPEKPPIPKPRRISKVDLNNPYLQKQKAAVFQKPVRKRSQVAPLPNIDELIESFEEEPPVIYKIPTPPPPPPPPKKRIPREVCDQLAGVPPPIRRIESGDSMSKKVYKDRRKNRVTSHEQETKKVYGIGISFERKASRRKKPKPPKTSRENAQYTINGVSERNGVNFYILGNICTLPATGFLIHGGHAKINNTYITINCGYRDVSPPPGPNPCDCLKKWNDSVMKYAKETKCYCNHHFDFGNEGPFPPDELPFFVKPTKYGQWQLNYDTIYDTDPKQIQIAKDMNKLRKTDSFFRTDSPPILKDDKKKKKKKNSKTSLAVGLNTKPEDYVKYALYPLKNQNIAARLPDVHLAPELIDWMQRRIHGPIKPDEKAEYLRKSTTYWSFFHSLDRNGFGHVPPPKVDEFSTRTTWLDKQKLNDKFNKYVQDYKTAMFTSHAYVTNLLWRTMYQPEFPDKQFRAIYFSYLYGHPGDLQLMDPYSYIKVNERKTILMNKRYVCLPAGAENLAQN